MQIRRRHIQGQAVYWGDAGPGRYRRGVLNCFQLKTMLLWCVLEFLDRNKFEASKNGNILFDEMFSCGCPTGSEGCSPAKWKKGRSQCNNSWPRHWRESKMSHSRKMVDAWPKKIPQLYHNYHNYTTILDLEMSRENLASRSLDRPRELIVFFIAPFSRIEMLKRNVESKFSFSSRTTRKNLDIVKKTGIYCLL